MTRHARAGTTLARRSLGLAILLLVVASLGAAAAALRPSGRPVAAAEPTVLAPPPRRAPTRRRRPRRRPTPDPDAEFSIVAAGDVLPHLPVLSSARTADGGYDFGAAARPAGPVGPGRRPRAVPPRGARHAARHRAERVPAVRHAAGDRVRAAGPGLGRLLDGVEPLRRPRLRRRHGDARRARRRGARPRRDRPERGRAVAAAAVHARPRPAGRSRSPTSPRPTAPTACRSTRTSRGR